jgi:hypothetical protein
MGLLDIDTKDIKKLEHLEQIGKAPPGIVEMVKALLNVRQSIFDVFGAFPQDNVIPYFYAFQNTSSNGAAGTPNGILGANGTALNQIRISADSAFIACSMRGVSDGPYTIFMQQDASDRQLQNIAVNADTVVGTAERPGPLHKPLLLPANTTLSFTLADLSGSNNNVWVTMGGFKVYNRKLG